jgi:hypothetical protein
MQTSTGFTTHRNQIKLQEFPLVARIFIAILLAAALIAWAPRKASAAGTGETASSGCANPTYWDNFFAYTPNTPNIAQSPCFIPLTGANTLPASSPSLYWEYFFKEDPVGPHIAPPFSLPVTGADTLSDSNASLDVETPLIPVTSVPEALPASIADYSPAQHARSPSRLKPCARSTRSTSLCRAEDLPGRRLLAVHQPG